jgi:hypothetical protein
MQHNLYISQVTVYFYKCFTHSDSTKGCICVRKKYLFNTCHQICIINVICSYLVWQNYNPCATLFFWGFIDDKTRTGANLSTYVHVEQQKFQHPTLLQMSSETKWMLGPNTGILVNFNATSCIDSQLISWLGDFKAELEYYHHRMTMLKSQPVPCMW